MKNVTCDLAKEMTGATHLKVMIYYMMKKTWGSLFSSLQARFYKCVYAGSLLQVKKIGMAIQTGRLKVTTVRNCSVLIGFLEL